MGLFANCKLVLPIVFIAAFFRVIISDPKDLVKSTKQGTTLETIGSPSLVETATSGRRFYGAATWPRYTPTCARCRSGQGRHAKRAMFSRRYLALSLDEPQSLPSAADESGIRRKLDEAAHTLAALGDQQDMCATWQLSSLA